MEGSTLFEVVTPGGNVGRYACRDETSDETIVRGIVGNDEYGIGSLPNLEGWAFDIGAHIGSVAIAVALDFPAVRVVALEPLPDNRKMLRHNVTLNGLDGRVITDERAAASFQEETVAIAHGFGSDLHRHIGNLYGEGDKSELVEAVALEKLLSDYGATEASFLKIDCEGCEWGFLADPAVVRVKVLAGEIHGKGDEGERILDLLASTHDVRVDRYLFRAARR